MMAREPEPLRKLFSGNLTDMFISETFYRISILAPELQCSGFLSEAGNTLYKVLSLSKALQFVVILNFEYCASRCHFSMQSRGCHILEQNSSAAECCVQNFIFGVKWMDLSTYTHSISPQTSVWIQDFLSTQCQLLFIFSNVYVIVCMDKVFFCVLTSENIWHSVKTRSSAILVSFITYNLSLHSGWIRLIR